MYYGRYLTNLLIRMGQQKQLGEWYLKTCSLAIEDVGGGNYPVIVRLRVFSISKTIAVFSDWLFG